MTEVTNVPGLAGAVLALIVIIIGCFGTLAAWLSRRDNKSTKDAEWRGEIKGTLNSILVGNTAIGDKVKNIESDLRTVCIQQAKTESKAESAHKRLDEHIQAGS